MIPTAHTSSDNIALQSILESFHLSSTRHFQIRSIGIISKKYIHLKHVQFVIYREDSRYFLCFQIPRNLWSAHFHIVSRISLSFGY